MREMLFAGVVLLGAAVQPACARQTPEELYRSGRYDDAIAALRSTTNPAERRTLVRALIETGRYEEAERAALNGTSRSAVPVALANVVGEALYARGERAAAEAAFERAASSNAPDALRARVNRAIAKWDRGAQAEALEEFDGFIDIYNSRRARTASDLTAVAIAVSYLGSRDPQLFHDAVRAYEEAASADGTYAEPKILEGNLFLDHYNSTDASALFREVLAVNPRHPDALLGLARAKAFDGTNEALALVDSSLAVNGASPTARAFRARLLLGLEDYDAALAEVERALEVNPASLEALAMLGAVHYLRGDDNAHSDARRRALELNPSYAAFDVTVAEMAIQHRRYSDAVNIARKGSAVDASNWNAHAVIGLTELRLGDVDGARRSLETAFAGDPYNVWVKNTLDLLDTYGDYVTRSTGRFELFLHTHEADLIELYMAPLGEEAYDSLARRYDTRPEPPIRVEVYPRHADFSVRSVGLSGLGALGVAFGNILAMDSPAARDAGGFNWGSTLWHEIAHAVTLAASRHHVPRWLTEGISVLEERRARQGWGEDLTLDFLVVLKAGRTLPVSELNAGFVRPRYPEQIAHAYYQASLVAEYIEMQWGDNALRDMLRRFATGATQDEVLRDVLQIEPAAFDAAFDAWMRERFATQLASIEVPSRVSLERGVPAQVDGPFVQALRAARASLAAGNMADAKREAERARAMFPEYAGADGPYLLLRAINEHAGDTTAAVAALRSHVMLREKDYDAHIALANALERLGEYRDAADILERSIYINPYDAAIHDRLANLYARTAQPVKVVRERRAILALDPPNRADALYRLAVALVDAGDTREARRQVLRALEVAPSFAEAQELLLRLEGAR